MTTLVHQTENLSCDHFNQSSSAKAEVSNLGYMLYIVTDFRIGQIGHDLGPRATLSCDDSLPTQNLRNCSEA